MSNINISSYNENIANNQTINSLNLQKVLNKYHSLLGLTIEEQLAINILEKLEFEIDNDDVFIPQHRHDIFTETDVVQELIRIIGYEKLIASMPNTSALTTENTLLNKINNIKQILVNRGYIENINFIFINPNEAKLFSNKELNNDLFLENPLIKEESFIRNSMLPNLLKNLSQNQNIDVESLSFFEEGKIYFGNKENEQRQIIQGIRSGLAISQNHFHESRMFDIFDVKQDVLLILSNILNISENKFNISPKYLQYCHPKKTFAITLGNIELGYFGEIHPSIQEYFNIKTPAMFFECLLYNISNDIMYKKNLFAAFTENNIQPIIREFSFIVDESMTIAQLINAFNDKNIIQSINVIDIYRNENNIGINKKSVMLQYIIQPREKSFDSEKLTELSDKIIQSMKIKVGGILRNFEN